MFDEKAHLEGTGSSTHLAEIFVLLADDDSVYLYLAAVTQLEGEVAIPGVVVPPGTWGCHCCFVEFVVSRLAEKDRKTMGEIANLMQWSDTPAELLSRHLVKARTFVNADISLWFFHQAGLSLTSLHRLQDRILAHGCISMASAVREMPTADHDAIFSA